MKLQTVLLMLTNFSVKYRIYYEDTDAGGVVYYANYLKFFERARTELLRSVGISQSSLLEQEKLAFVVKRCEIDYVSSAKLDDEVEIVTKITEIRPASILMKQDMVKETQTLSSLNVEIVCVDSQNFRPKKIPQNIKDLL